MAAEGGGPRCRLEFAVQMTCQNCVEAIQSSLRGTPGLEVLDVRLDSQSVLVETSLSTEEVHGLLEGTGRKAVLKGMGGAVPHPPGSAAVAMVSGPGVIQGVVRFLQLSQEKCLIDGTIDGLQPGPHGIHVHEFGDITGSCDSCGDHFNPDGECHGGPQDVHRVNCSLPTSTISKACWRSWQYLGHHQRESFVSDGRQPAEGEASPEQVSSQVSDIIGRSLVVDSGADDLGRGNHPLSKVTGNSGQRVACGIIARSAGLFENPKKICACDGVTLWEEREQPLAGPGRRAASQPTPHL
ncbi:copper chaperone for superoxide dismutase isoform X1 [Hemicordylus capensis]|uniref:copper chaperone for superoxide dismutase isoform X1 n=1 Tax=Hemicordylus capensis TaxID=884348 RepID=UPI0023041376|nr:copper chaperone for superoxide dismutase isoform X1 [Hemicordylus capensis]